MDITKTVQLIIECENEDKIRDICTIKYRLPIIGSVAVEIDEKRLNALKSISGVSAVHQNTHITMQMNHVRTALNADGCGCTGKGVTIAVLDTGITKSADFEDRIKYFGDFVNGRTEPYDDNGHGTHVSGICSGSGALSNGLYRGIAPQSDIVMLKTLNSEGKGNAADVIAGIQWILDNKEKYGIRIVNMSVGAAAGGISDPLVKAVEALWDSGIIIVTAAGNNGPMPGTISSPGISKKVITVGSSDDDIEVQVCGTAMKNFSGRGPTSECIVKPDVVAPGSNIVSCLAPNVHNSGTAANPNYQSLSGTSMSTPMVSGAAALLLEKQPNLSPDDVKYMIKTSSTDLKYPHNRQGWGLLNIGRLLSQEVIYVRK